jgi:serine/threonine protein kinase
MQTNAGRQLGNYTLLRLIGHGGFANVYLGEHIYLKTQAAIKVLQLRLGDEERDQFINEARTIAHLVHPRIIRVLDFGVQEHTPYLVMDYAPNGTLRQRHASGTRLPLATIVSYVKQVASALQYAHDQHFIHRDVKPGNMLIGRHDEILLSDFGTALIAHSTDSQDTEDTVGTVAYMAPEQIEGKPRPATDQYALGIVVYEWLSGELPFKGSLQEIIAQQMAAIPRSLHARFPDISTDIEEAVMMALSKDPYERFDNVQAFAHALEEAYHSQKASPGVLLPATSNRTRPSPPFTLHEQTVPASIHPVQSQTSRPSPQQMMATEAYTPPRDSRKPVEEQPRDRLKPTDHAGREVAMSPARQLITMLTGIFLYGVLYYFIVNLSQQNSVFASDALFGLSIVIPMFFGAAFGPAVGLVTAIGGYLIGHSFGNIPQYWNNAIGTGLIGLISGFAILKTHRRYNRFKVYGTAVLYALLGILIGEGFANCTSIWVARNTFGNALLNFLLFSIFEGISAVILLPIFLGIYSIFTRGRKRSFT